ncbi:MAG: phosphoenolpyruvate carboxykinase (ATP) [Bacteroidetes bacterium]|nr:phosphoenolpyruvate carboxykinase (ATP) [Bacteroidota bacterium]
MKEYGPKGKNNSLPALGITNAKTIYWNQTPQQLVDATLNAKQGSLCDTGAIAVDTGEFTGRSPKDKFCVADAITENSVWWGDINIKFTPEKFDALHKRVTDYLAEKEIWVRDSYACADPEYRLNIRVITEYAWSNLFANNLFLRPAENEIENFKPDWHIICAPGFKADPKIDGTRQHNFAILNLTKKIILIGGTGYTGEIKKGIFTLLNYILPHEKGVLSMHCSANEGVNGDTAIFFGLSGTGKTTLSADPKRKLIGDDEHGWSEKTVFNFEGGCYAKCIDLSKEKEPEIWDAIKTGALLENIEFLPGTNTVDFSSTKKTENTRVAYPIHHIANAKEPSIGSAPKNIFFLTADAFGVLPPISKLNTAQAMYNFISGYTAKVAGTEMGITEPQTTFSACFGKAFLPLHPGKYAELLGKKLKANPDINVWLVNTGWTGGAYGVGSRIKLSYTRALITAALEGKLANTEFQSLPVFNLSYPKSCPNVPTEILNPRDTWKDKAAYDATANKLAAQFVKNFEQYASGVSKEILDAAPKAQMVNA